MNPLYQAHFGLKGEPFNVTPDPRFLYLSPCHREALAQLTYGVKARKGFIVLTGEVGTGKTTLIHALLSEIATDTQTALIFNTILGPQDLLRHICEDFGLVDPGVNHKGLPDYLTLLNRFLLESYRKGENVVLIMDEAQNLGAEVLESIRLLSNFETSEDKLLQILLVGQPELAVRLNSSELRQLKQRVALRYHLRPLAFDEAREYIGKRLEIAGGNASIFATKALEATFLCSAGIPRLINILCDNSLLTAYALGLKQIEPGIIYEVAADLHLKWQRRPDQVSQFQQPETARQPSISKVSEEKVHGGAKVQARTPVERSGGTASRGIAMRTSTDVLQEMFFERMTRALTNAMGPLAPLVMDEQIAALHERVESFPVSRWRELITATSREILDARLKAQFEQQMLALLSQDGKGGA